MPLEAFLRPRVDEARARHAGAPLERFDAAFDTLVGKRRVFAPQPTFMLYPRLPAIEFLDRGHFPWLAAFEAAADEIRAEARAALAQAADDFVPYISKPAGSPVDQWLELNNSKRWSTYFLIKNGKRVEEHLARCPRTAALLDAAPLCEIRGHAGAHRRHQHPLHRAHGAGRAARVRLPRGRRDPRVARGPRLGVRRQLRA